MYETLAANKREGCSDHEVIARVVEVVQVT